MASGIHADDHDCSKINFSQPRGTPSSGVVGSEVADPKQVRVDLEDCLLAGYKVVGTGKHASQISLSGFNVDQSVYLPAGGRAGIERLVQSPL